jgi:hypothetical protein
MFSAIAAGMAERGPAVTATSALAMFTQRTQTCRRQEMQGAGLDRFI